ncbi:MAG: hypothetical protein ABIG67_08305, partial [Pseudomonadota bacterium]
PEASIALSIVLFPGFRLVGRNDKSLCDNLKLASPEGEGFSSSPNGTLNPCLRYAGIITTFLYSNIPIAEQSVAKVKEAL